ncbi:MAG: hypothetical protein KGJ37_07165 [Verrucomicrobiota bacterium]|nr:hypothetical protein [Verrucomicrobiota bacterium]
MKPLCLSALLAVLLTGCASAQEQPAPPPPVVPASPPPAPYPPPDNQKVYGATRQPLVTPETANAVVEKFRAAFAKPEGAPRFVFYVNRELIDADSGLKLTRRVERTETERHETKSDMEAPASTNGPQTQVNVSVSGNAGNSNPTLGKGTASSKSEKVNAENSYELKNSAAPTLADRETVREVERLFGRPFRAAGARLADQKVAASLLADKPIDMIAGSDQARKDRAALASVADIAVEVLVSSRNVTLPGISGDQVVTVPDIQATAIRLKDSAIIGQAASSDVLGKDVQAARLARVYDVRDITEATAIALMQDMLGTK